jgi:hypothetical protein
MNETILAMWNDIDNLVKMTYLKPYKAYLSITKTESLESKKKYYILATDNIKSINFGEVECVLFDDKIEVIFNVKQFEKTIIVKDDDEEKYLDDVLLHLNKINEEAKKNLNLLSN